MSTGRAVIAKNNYGKRHKRVTENHLVNIEYQLFTIFGSMITCFKKFHMIEHPALTAKRFFF